MHYFVEVHNSPTLSFLHALLVSILPVTLVLTPVISNKHLQGDRSTERKWEKGARWTTENLLSDRARSIANSWEIFNKLWPFVQKYKEKSQYEQIS